jgi:hypothetical protein
MKRVEFIGVLLALYKFSLGSLRFCVNEMEPELRELGNDEALNRVDKSREAIDEARSKEYIWNQQKQQDKLSRKEATRIDDELDTTLSAMYQTLEGFAKLEGTSDKGAMAAEIVDTLFPSGVFPITSQSFEDQHGSVLEVTERLRSEFADESQKLGIGDYVDKLEELNEEFGRELSERDREISYDEVEAAYTEAQNQFHGLVAQVMADYYEDMETFNRIMEPVWEQTERTRRGYQRSGEAPPVDPESGEPLEPTGEGDNPEGDGQPDGGTNSPDDGESEGQSEGDGESSSGDGGS